MTSDDDVEIKEEPAEVVELVSSEDEAKPDLAALQAATADKPAPPTKSGTYIIYILNIFI